MVQFARSRRQTPASKKRSGIKAEKTTETSSNPLRLILKCVEQPHVFSVPVADNSIIVGRLIGDFVPDIDLSPVRAVDCGVSRRHAALTLREGELYLEDLNSTNGTMINGFQLTPERQYLLRSGDEIELGTLRLTVTVVRIPAR